MRPDVKERTRARPLTGADSVEGKSSRVVGRFTRGLSSATAAAAAANVAAAAALRLPMRLRPPAPLLRAVPARLTRPPAALGRPPVVPSPSDMRFTAVMAASAAVAIPPVMLSRWISRNRIPSTADIEFEWPRVRPPCTTDDTCRGRGGSFPLLLGGSIGALLPRKPSCRGSTNESVWNQFS